MATSKEIVVKINGDTTGLEKAVDGVDKELGRMNKSVAGVASVFAGAFAVDQIVNVVGSLSSLATELDVLDKKTSTVFEGSADSVRKWADANNEAMGMSDEKLAGLAAGFGDLLKPMGFTAEQAAAMSTEVVGLSGALSAWTGGTKSAAEVSDILAKAMLGETDGLKALGISISAAEIEARVFEKGQKDLTGAAKEQAEAVATQELIFEKSTDAQKAWADGSMSAIQSQNELKAKLDDLKATLADKLMPVFATVTGFAVNTLIPAFESMAGAVRDLYTNQIRPFIDFLREHEEVLIGVGVAIGVVIVGAVWAAVPAIAAWAVAQWAAAGAVIATYAPIAALAVGIAALVAGVIWAYQNWEFFRVAVDAVAGFLTGVLWPALQTVSEWLWDKLSPGVSAVVSAFTDYLIPAVSTVAGWLFDRLGPAFQLQVDVMQAVWDKAGPVFGFVRDAVGWVIDKNAELVLSFGVLVSAIADKIGPVKDTLVAPFRAAFNAIASAWNSTVGKLSFQVPGWVPELGGKGFSMPTIPGYATGGWSSGGVIRVGERGPENIIVPGGTQVVPNHALSSGGAITVNVATNANPWDIAREIDWLMRTGGR